MRKNTGARWEITIDGTTRTYRDIKELAIEGAKYLKQINPNSEVVVRDLEGELSPNLGDGRDQAAAA